MNEKLKHWKEFLSGKSIERCSMEVSIKNKNNLKSFAVLGIVMMSFAIVFGWLMKDVFTFGAEFIIMWVYFILVHVAIKLLQKHIKHSTATFYLCLTPLMIMGIIIGTFGDSTEPSITIMVFICVLPMFILDKPWRIVLFILCTSVIYTICCYEAKANELFIADMIDLVLFTILGIGVNCLILRDRIDNVEHAREMRVISETDVLTKLYNRRAGEERVMQLIDHGKNGMFMLIDLDEFKKINDNYGHTIGDKVLINIALCLRQSFRDDDVIMRFGGDEFAIFTPNVVSNEDIKVFIDLMMNKISDLTILDIPNYNFTISVGCTFVDSKDKITFDTIYFESDTALYTAKGKGKNTYCFFEKNT